MTKVGNKMFRTTVGKNKARRGPNKAVLLTQLKQLEKVTNQNSLIKLKNI